MMNFLYIALILGTAMRVWGSQTRGTNSNDLVVYGFGLTIGAFIPLGFLYGLQQVIIAFFVQWAFALLFQKIFPKYR